MAATKGLINWALGYYSSLYKQALDTWFFQSFIYDIHETHIYMKAAGYG